eukprot:5064600-Lingulodinium_polyedra.AAC.1
MTVVATCALGTGSLAKYSSSKFLTTAASASGGRPQTSQTGFVHTGVKLARRRLHRAATWPDGVTSAPTVHDS